MADIDSLVIRPFAADDRDRVNAFFDQMGPESRSFFNAGDGHRRYAMEWFDGRDKDTERFMALDGDRMVGYVFFYGARTRTPWLGIAIAEDYKGRHLGRRLMAFMEATARAEGKGGIFLTTHIANVRAQALYTGAGYQRLGVASDGEALFFRYFEEETR